MILNSTSLRSLYTGFSTAFQGGFAGVAPQYTRVAMTVPSTTRANEYGWMGEIPRIREWLGDRQVKNLALSNYTIRNKSFELTVGVDRDDIDDDNLGVYAPLFSELGRAAATFPDELVWPLLKAGFATTCYDGQYFFDTDHPVLAADGETVNSVSNTGGGGGTPWFLLDLTRAVKPVVFQDRKSLGNLVRKDAETDDNVFFKKQLVYGVDGRCNVGFGLWQLAYGSKQTLDSAAYAAARAAMSGMLGDHGRPLGIRPTHLVVPPALEQAGRKLLVNTLTTGGETNEWAGTAELIVVPWLA